MFARLLLVLLLLLAALPAQAQNGAARLNVGDVIQVTLPGEEAFAQPFQIDREGRLNLPEVGMLDVAGLTVPQARDRVRAALAQSFRDLGRFNLTLRERRLLLSVGGFVRNPGPVELPAGANVQQAIVAAGGLMQGAQLDRMQLRRGSRVITFDYKRFLDTGARDALPALRPLDELFVPASPLTGNVQIDFDARTLAAAGDAAEDRTSVRVSARCRVRAASPGARA